MTSSMPAAEFEIDIELMARLVQEQHPDLADLPLELVANGWDNAVARLGADRGLRLPRREAAVSLILNEQRWLPELAPRLPLPIPVPERVGRPGAGYPWPWSIVSFRPGEIAAHTPPADFGVAAEAIGEFLGALHVTAPEHAPRNAFRGIPLAGREAVLVANLALLGGLVDEPRVTRLWRDAVQAPVWDRPPVWLHGDLHPANIIVHQGRISGVIDFGDLTSGDPATDLAAIWMLLPASAHDRFWAVYAATAEHPVGDEVRRRARGWALAFALVFLAHSADNPLMAGIGRRTLDAVLA
jgi:aminoglycoside phosphotransferase (APT) family kinase protein